MEFRSWQQQEPEFDSVEAWTAFRNEFDGPEFYTDWLEDHKEPEEPEKPDTCDYEWSDKDPLSNYSNLDMEKEPVKEPLPSAIEKYDQQQIFQLFYTLPERHGDRGDRALLAT